MPKKNAPLSVNLLPQATKSSFGEKFLAWCLTFGRYIIIGTEIIVLLAFLSRFKLDRDYIDLNDKVKEEQQVLASLQTTEHNVNQLQRRLSQIKGIDTKQGRGILSLTSVAQVTPQGVTYRDITVVGDKVTIVGFATDTNQISQFVQNLSSLPLFQKGSVVLDNVGKSSQQDGSVIQFTIIAVVQKEEV